MYTTTITYVRINLLPMLLAVGGVQFSLSLI